MKDKCTNCGKTKAKEYWDFDDGTVLCKDCYEKKINGEKLVIDKKLKNEKEPKSFYQHFLNGVGYFCLYLFIMHIMGNSPQTGSTMTLWVGRIGIGIIIGCIYAFIKIKHKRKNGDLK